MRLQSHLCSATNFNWREGIYLYFNKIAIPPLLCHQFQLERRYIFIQWDWNPTYLAPISIGEKVYVIQWDCNPTSPLCHQSQSERREGIFLFNEIVIPPLPPISIGEKVYFYSIILQSHSHLCHQFQLERRYIFSPIFIQWDCLCWIDCNPTSVNTFNRREWEGLFWVSDIKIPGSWPPLPLVSGREVVFINWDFTTKLILVENKST